MIFPETENERRGMLWSVGLTLPAVALSAVLLLVPIPRTPWQRQISSIFDFGHFVLFAVVMLWLWVLSKRNIGLSLCVSAAVAGICEAGQFFSGRNVCLPDFWRGLMGVLFAGVMIHACGPLRTFRERAGHAVLALGLAAWPVAEVLPTVAAACGKLHSYCVRDAVTLANCLEDSRRPEPQLSPELGTITGSSSPAATIRRFNLSANCLRTSAKAGW